LGEILLKLIKNKSMSLLLSVLALLSFSSIAWAGTLYTTLPATNITKTSATLNGNAQATRYAPTGERFDWGLTTNYGNSVASSPQGAGNTSANISNLTCGTTYHYRFWGTPAKSGTTNEGADMTFTTSACAPQPTNGFQGSFAPNNWQEGSNAPINLINTSGAPASVLLNSYPVWSVSASSFTYKATMSGTVSFSYSYAYSPKTMSSPSQCSAAFVLNANNTILTAASPNSQNGAKQFTVNAGDTFGFLLGANSPGCMCNNKSNLGLPPSTLTISNFVFTPTTSSEE